MLRELIGGIIATLVAAGPAGAGRLEDERRGEFFSFFHLEPSAPAKPDGQGRTWHAFRSAGAKFRPLVELAVLTDQSGAIVSVRLGLDRTFVDHPSEGVFARDIAKSYLAWALAKPVPDEAAALIENIADFAAAGAPVLRAGEPRRPRPDTTGGYDVYLGRAGWVEIALPRQTVTLTNVAGALPAADIAAVSAQANRDGASGRLRWLAIDVDSRRQAGPAR